LTIHRRTFSYNLRKTSKPKKVNRRGRKYALVVRRIIDEKGRYRDTTVDIKSDALCRVLLDINAGVEGLELTKNEPEVGLKYLLLALDRTVSDTTIYRLIPQSYSTRTEDLKIV
jgi:hypothetical protein